MAAHAPHVEWRCLICPRREMRMPSRARAKCCYRCRGEHLRRFGNVGQRRSVDNRIRRVMFVKGLTRERAIDYVAGWREGFHAGQSNRYRGLRVGSAEWEQLAS